jgi:hypothetical protein
MRTIGRLLQYAGLMVPPVAIAIELTSSWKPIRDGVAGMLLLLVASVCLFAIGRLLEGHARGNR